MPADFFKKKWGERLIIEAFFEKELEEYKEYEEEMKKKYE